LAASDYRLFGSPEKALRGRRFEVMKKSDKRCTLGVATNQKHFFSDGIKKLVER
jgi:hypothetical protein